MISPLAHHEPSQPPSGDYVWFATTATFDKHARRRSISHCEVTAKTWKAAHDAAAVKLGADPAWVECDRIRPVCPCEGEAEDPGAHLPDCPWNEGRAET
jgi:hypothetical protein